jgi:hypothetical protein
MKEAIKRSFLNLTLALIFAFLYSLQIDVVLTPVFPDWKLNFEKIFWILFFTHLVGGVIVRGNK